MEYIEYIWNIFCIEDAAIMDNSIYALLYDSSLVAKWSFSSERVVFYFLTPPNPFWILDIKRIWRGY